MIENTKLVSAGFHRASGKTGLIRVSSVESGSAAGRTPPTPAGAVFLDRDGVLNRRPPPHRYVRSPAEFHWLPRVPESLARLSAAGHRLVVVSNQRGVARGQVTWESLRAIERRMTAELDVAGADLLGTYYCPHDIEQGCACRKPRPGMLLRAAAEHGIDLRSSVMVGDAETDVHAGLAVGCRTILIGPLTTSTDAHGVVRDLPAATELILSGQV